MTKTAEEMKKAERVFACFMFEESSLFCQCYLLDGKYYNLFADFDGLYHEIEFYNKSTEQRVYYISVNYKDLSEIDPYVKPAPLLFSNTNINNA